MPMVPMVKQTQTDRFVEMALQSGDMEKLEKMLDLKVRFDKEEARKSFTSALAKFKSEDIVIIKDREVSFPSQDKQTISLSLPQSQYRPHTNFMRLETTVLYFNHRRPGLLRDPVHY